MKDESDVENLFTRRLLEFFGYTDSLIKTKKSLNVLVIGKGSKKENYKPDYVCFQDKKPKIVIDAKSPTENIDNYTYQISGYSLGLNRKFKGKNPIRFAALTNGLYFKLYNWDEEEPILVLKFEDFVKGNKKFERLESLISLESIKKQTGKDEILVDNFLAKPSVEEVKSAFNKCHNVIWKKEKISPTDAFYEFSKIIFVKLNEDKRIRDIIESGKSLKRTDFKFSIEWLNERESETESPLSSILFAELQNKLQDEIEKNKKKPIFNKGEGIELKAPTIKEVVKILQNYDLYTIDEDLNGRMFETFLNATIRGRELGQYFTPRKVVKFMTKLANIQIKRQNGEIKVDSVLDACCGSGGFLIDTMADLIEKVKKNSSLKPYLEETMEKIRTEAIFGIEANPKISRIARMNMYVHGDGGSRIYCADSLDKEVSIWRGTNKGIKKELEELKGLLVEQKKKFDVVLTNPPFSMAYKSKDKDEKVILEQYADTEERKNISYEKGKNILKSSVKSNVLFIARYCDLLKNGGRMFIILDNSVLNSYTHKDYRNFIRKNFIIKAVFQLPTHTFVNQEAGGITSILYLEKRKSTEQEQSPIFARIINRVGHGTSGKEENEDDFDNVLKEYLKFEEKGKPYLHGEKEIKDFENDDLFLINNDMINDRLDFFYYQPSYHKLLENLRKKEKEGKCNLKKLDDYTRVEGMNDEEKTKLEESGENPRYKYIGISAIDRERGFVMSGEWQEGTKKDLPARAKLFLNTNDVLFSKPFRSLQKVMIVPEELNNQLGSSGFWGIRPKDYDEACLLWSIFRSKLIQKQLIHLASGYTQRELNDEYLKKYLIIPIPNDGTKSSKFIAENIEKAKKSRINELEAINNILTEPIEAIK
ncbi:N-6 DNA methylase [Candidatus Woesearchaeota archaeon]|nr:N-6 DNA methylase [Candidatus Woesearchaeota archaeon]